MDKVQKILYMASTPTKKNNGALPYPVAENEIRGIIDSLLQSYKFKCTETPNISTRALKTRGILDNISTVLELILCHETDDIQSSEIKATFFFEGYLTQSDEPEYLISGRYKNNYKEAIYRPQIIKSTADISTYLNTVLKDISNKI